MRKKELHIPETSVEYVQVAVTQSRAALDIGWTVNMAIIPDGKDEPEPDDWEAATWAPSGTDIEALVGPGTSHDLPEGRYGVWVKIDTGTETPVRRAGTLVVT